MGSQNYVHMIGLCMHLGCMNVRHTHINKQAKPPYIPERKSPLHVAWLSQFCSILIGVLQHHEVSASILHTKAFYDLVVLYRSYSAFISHTLRGHGAPLPVPVTVPVSLCPCSDEFFPSVINQIFSAVKLIWWDSYSASCHSIGS